MRMKLKKNTKSKWIWRYIKKNMEEKDKDFKELRITTNLESRKKSQINLRTVAIMKRLRKVFAEV